MKLLAFAASHRPESLNKKLILLAAEKARSLNVETDVAEYGEFDMPVYNDTFTDNQPEVTRKFSERCKDVDGIIIAMPEYNWSFPGSLKNIIDWTSRIDNNNLAGKTVLLTSATTGARGGIAGLQQFKSPLEALHMIVFHKVFPLSHAQNAFTEDGKLKDKMQQELFFNIITGYISFTKKLSQT
ncbi:MAG: NAD(P)H-dependent oxidoreductase [Rickettsiales bacterium]